MILDQYPRDEKVTTSQTNRGMAVAAAVVAHMRKPPLNRSFDSEETGRGMPAPEACIISGRLDRQVISGTLGVTWQSRKISLTHDRLWVGKPEGSDVLDFIPLIEVGIECRPS
jgi:hypothetical protein